MKVLLYLMSCKFLCKVTKMKANHNKVPDYLIFVAVVSSYAKLLNWGQMTAQYLRPLNWSMQKK